MSEQFITGHQFCPRCQETTDIIKTERFPFDDEYETEVEEKCPCGYHREVSFHSSNFTTAEKHRQDGHHFYDAVESKTKQLIKTVLDYARYPTQSSRPSLHQIKRIMADATISEFYEIYYRLANASEIALVEFNGVSEWTNAASFTRAFGADSMNMDDYYDNEVQSEARNPAATQKAVDSMIDLLKLAEPKAN